LGLSGLLGACVSGVEKPIPLQVYVETGEGGRWRKQSDNIKEIRQALGQITEMLRLARNDVELIFSFVEGSRFVDEVRYRTGLGLGPNLMLARMRATRGLVEAGLTLPVQLDDAAPTDIGEELCSGLSRDDELEMLPFVVFPQVACINKQMLDTPLTTKRALLEAAAEDARFGLPYPFRNLVWSINGLRLEALIRDGLGSGRAVAGNDT